MVNNDGERGLSGLATEPGFAGVLGVVYMALSIYFVQLKKISKKIFVYIVCLSLVIVFLSKSGSAIVYLTLMLFTVLFLSRIRLYVKLLSVIFGFLLGYLGLIFLEGDRSFYILGYLLNDPLFLIFNDRSLMYRLVPMIAGMESFLQGNLFGNGVGTFSILAPSVFESLEYAHYFQDAASTADTVLSSFSYYLFELGLFFLVFVISQSNTT